MKEFKPDLVSALKDNVAEKQEAIDRLLRYNRELEDRMEALMVEYYHYRGFNGGSKKNKEVKFNIVQAIKGLLPDKSEAYLDGAQLSIYPSTVVDSKAINIKISKIITDRQLQCSINSVKIFNADPIK